MDIFGTILEEIKLFMENLSKTQGEEGKKELAKNHLNQMYETMMKQIFINDSLSKAIEAFCSTETAIYINDRVKSKVKSYQVDPKFLQMIKENRKAFDKALNSLKCNDEEDVIGEMRCVYDDLYNYCVMAINSIHCKKSIIMDTLDASEIEELLVLFIDIIANGTKGFVMK